MPTTSSQTSTRRSRRRNPVPLAIWLMISAGLIALAFWAQSEDGTTEDALYDVDLAINGLFFYGIVIAGSLLVALAYRRPLRALGFRRFRLRWLWISFGIVVLTIVVALVLEPVLHGGEQQGLAPDEWQPEHATAFGLNSAVVVLLAPFAEELFFRGLGVRVLGFLGSIGAIVGTAFAFGLAHGILVALPSLVVFGIGLAWVRIRAESVWPGIIAHSAYNGVALALLFATLE
jgi:hypothetical protein